MRLNYKKINIMEFPLARVGEFTFDWVKLAGDAKIFVEDNEVIYLFGSDFYNHEDISEAVVRTLTDLKERYKSFVDFTGNTSYKDFLIYKCGAVAVMEGVDRKQAYITCETPERGPLKTIAGKYIHERYKFIDVEPFRTAIKKKDS